MKYRIVRIPAYYGGYIGGSYDYRYIIQKKRWFWIGWKDLVTYDDENQALDMYNSLKSGARLPKLYKV